MGLAGGSSSLCSRTVLGGMTVPVAVRIMVGARLLNADRVLRCLKHSCPQGSEYPKQGPNSSQLALVSRTNDMTRFCTCCIDGRLFCVGALFRPSSLRGVPMLRCSWLSDPSAPAQDRHGHFVDPHLPVKGWIRSHGHSHRWDVSSGGLSGRYPPLRWPMVQANLGRTTTALGPDGCPPEALRGYDRNLRRGWE